MRTEAGPRVLSSTLASVVGWSLTAALAAVFGAGGCARAAQSESATGAPDTTPVDKALDEAPSVRLYRTREEQREAGVQRRITPWLTVSSLAEGELLYRDFDTRSGNAEDSGREDSASLQLGFVLAPVSFAKAELILEYDTDNDRVESDEALVAAEHGAWELALGKQYTPLGVYFSNFVSGPLLEFGETQASRVATLSYGPDDDLDVSLSAYRGRARKAGSKGGEWNWSAGLELWLGPRWSVGLSYQSDLADADSRLLEDSDDRYRKRVPAVSGFALWSADRFEVSVEFVAATAAFDELEPDRNRPRAWNVEAVHFLANSTTELAFRVEGSEQLEDAPSYRFGPAITWRIGRLASLTLEYLHGEYSDALATTQSDDAYEDVDSVGAILSVAF